MELAILLILLVLVELVITVWLLAKHREYLRRVHVMESRIDGWCENVDSCNCGHSCAREPLAAPSADVSELVKHATPEDIEQARQVLAALGLGGDDGHSKQ